MSVNKVILIGNVGKDPDVRYLENNVCVANFTLATTERGYTTQSGIQIPDKTEWHNIVVWRGLADNMELLGRRDGQSSPSSAPVMSQSQNNPSPANTSYNSPIENSSDNDLPF